MFGKKKKNKNTVNEHDAFRAASRISAYPAIATISIGDLVRLTQVEGIVTIYYGGVEMYKGRASDMKEDAMEFMIFDEDYAIESIHASRFADVGLVINLVLR